MFTEGVTYSIASIQIKNQGSILYMSLTKYLVDILEFVDEFSGNRRAID